MTLAKNKKLSIRINQSVYDALSKLANDQNIETNAFIERELNVLAVNSGYMLDIDKKYIELENTIIKKAVSKALELEKHQFDSHFTLTVFRALMKDMTFRNLYEEAIEGDAYANGLPKKSPLNMYLGWYIKNAVGADPVMGSNGKPRRAQVKNEPIQSYTLLQRSK